MNSIDDITKFQRLIVTPGDEHQKLYEDLIEEEWKEFESAIEIGNKIKEACDVIVVCIGYRVAASNVIGVVDGDVCVTKFWKAFTWLNDALGEDAANKALRLVNESNLSKFIFDEKNVSESLLWYSDRGIKTYGEAVDGRLIGIFSSEDQKVGGKEYKKGKLLKAEPFYKPVNEAELAGLVK